MSTSSSLSNPHDRFFKHFLADPERARAFLRHVLPPDVRRHLNLDTLRRENVSFVDPDLRAHQGDVLFRVTLISGEPAYVYVLFEHKSYPDRWVAWQVLRYMVRIWERMWPREGRLAPIVPVVVYHGVLPWRGPMAFEDLVTAPEALQVYVPAFQYRLYDLSVEEDAVLWQETVIGAWLALMKYIQRPDLEARLEDIFRAFARWLAIAGTSTGVEALVTLLRYVAEAGDRVSEARVREAVERALPAGGEAMATLAQQWLEQGRREGLQQGLQQGLRQGLRQGILALLRVRFTPSEQWLAAMAERLNEVDDVNRLQALLDLAGQVESQEAFEAALEA